MFLSPAKLHLRFCCKRKMTTNGKRNKRERRRLGTPAFPVHVEGYSPSAADAPRKATPKS